MLAAHGLPWRGLSRHRGQTDRQTDRPGAHGGKQEVPGQDGQGACYFDHAQRLQKPTDLADFFFYYFFFVKK